MKIDDRYISTNSQTINEKAYSPTSTIGQTNVNNGVIEP